MRLNFTTLLILIIFSLLSNSLSKLGVEVYHLEINRENNPNLIKKIGTYGTVGLVTNGSNANIFNSSDIEDLTLFKGIFKDRFTGTENNFDCRLWNPKKSNLIVLCSMEDNYNLSTSSYEFIADPFFYNGYIINITSEENLYIEFEQFYENIPFLYSEQQDIDLNTEKDFYELSFKMESIYPQMLFLSEKEEINTFAPLNNCSTEKNKLFCQVKKEILQELFTYNTSLSLIYPSQQYGAINYEFVLDINKIYEQQKENITIELTEVLNVVSEIDSVVAIRTNITQIDPLTTKMFLSKFYNSTTYFDKSCYFKKYDNNETNLLLFCKMDAIGKFDFYIEEEKIVYNDIHYKYNFILIRNEIYDRINVDGNGKKILLNTPEVLDFTRSRSFVVEYFLSGAQFFQDIKLNPDSPSLTCEVNSNYYKRCIVDSTHFEGKETGYYYTYYKNHLNKSEIAYDAKPLKVILEKSIIIKVKYEDNKDIITLGSQLEEAGRYSYPTVPLITDFDDTDTNIFNAYDIEEKTYRNIYLIINGKGDYRNNFRLSKPKKGKLRMFIEMINFPYNIVNITFEKFSIRVYDDLTIIFKTDDSFQIKNINKPISFLYSDPQTIDLDQEVESYDLKFKCDLFNKDVFYLFSGSTYIPVDNCSKERKDFICKIKKETIEENLIRKGNFKMAALNNEFGSLPLNYVEDIIITYNDTSNKKEVRVVVNYPYATNSRIGQAFAYKTNIYSTSNFISDKFNLTFIRSYFYTESQETCYLKKTEDQSQWYNVILLCTINEGGTFLLKEQNVVLGDIHYKYNFSIRKLEDQNYIQILNPGNQILFTYPLHQNLTFEEIGIFKYIMKSPNMSDDMIVSHNDTLKQKFNCTNIDYVKICVTNMTYFLNKPNGFYYTYYFDNNPPYQGLFYDSKPFNLIVPKNNLIILRIKESLNPPISTGINGIIYFHSDYYDNNNIFNDSDLEDITIFNATLNDQYDKIHNATCRLWKPSQESVKILCNLLENLHNNNNVRGFYLYYLKLNDVLFNYNNYQISIHSEDFISIHYHIAFFPFLYSDVQYINDIESKDTYELRFKILSYNNDLLHLYYNNIYIILDKCEVIGKELVCQITNKTLEENLGDYSTNKTLSLRAYNDELYFSFNLVFGINIKSSQNINKKTFSIYLNRVLVNTTTYPSSFVYETTLDSVSVLKTSTFKRLRFYGKTTNYLLDCYFKKNLINNLMLFCTSDYSDDIRLEYISSQISLNDIHLRYNFLITRQSSYDIVHTEGIPYLNISEVYPKLIDLSLDDSKYLFYFSFSYDSKAPNFRLNINSTDLVCINHANSMREISSKCIVPLSHFKGLKTDYYYTYFKNYKNEWTINYEVSPIYVILPEENTIILRIKEENNKNVKKMGLQRIISFNSDYDDSIDNIFDEIDIKDNTTFNTLLLDDKGNVYKASCWLWKPKNKNIRIFCELEIPLLNFEQNVTLKTTNFIYNGYNIFIYSKHSIKVNQYDYNISFLYSNEQKINIVDYTYTYEFKFNFEEINPSDIFYLYGETNESSFFDHCRKESETQKILSCYIYKDQIEEILTVNNAQFKLGVLNKNIGAYFLEEVLNITISYTVQRDWIFVKIGKLLNNITEVGVAVAYEMNITDGIINQNLNTLTFSYFKNFGFCRFKRTNLNGLLLLCTPLKEGETYLGSVSSKTFGDIHYKYSFWIENSSNYDTVYVNNCGSEIYLMQPKELDLTLEDSLTVDYITDKPKLVNNLKINPDSEDLKCINYEHNKRCNITFNHFKEKKNGYYYIFHSNHLGESSVYYSSSPQKVILTTDDIIVIRIKKELNKNEILLGKEGTLAFVTNYNDDELNIFNIEDIEESTTFETTLIDEYKKRHITKCRLWKPLGENLRLFCYIDQYIKNETIQVTLTTVNFTYNNHTIYVKSSDPIVVRRSLLQLPFLYSQKQNINIDENILSYTFKFNIDHYYNNLLYLYRQNSYIVLDNCKVDSKILTCVIEKSKLEENLILDFNTNNVFELSAFIENNGTIVFDSVFDITIRYTNVTRKNCYLSIGRLLNKVSESDAVVAYRTNITSIQNLKTNRFNLPFYDLLNDEISQGNCYFKKSEFDSMFLMCDIIGNGYFYILEIDEIISLTNVSHLYNFIIDIMDIEIYDVIRLAEYGSEVLLTYPQILNFTLEDSITIKYIMTSNSYSNNIKINPDSDYLDCKYNNGFQYCIVPMSHFIGKENGYYYTHHLNHLNSLSIFYDSIPFNVVLRPDDTIVIRIKKEDNGNHIQIGKQGTLAFVTNYNDDELNIFNISDIEEKTAFESEITDEEGNKYNTKCRLWKPLGQKLVLFCKLDEELKYSFQYLSLDLINFKYNNYSIIIKFEEAIYTRQFDYEIPFIYSDKQEISIKEGIDQYEFKFYSDNYNNELLYIYNDVNYILFDYCNKEGKYLICQIQSDKLEDNLGNIASNISFKLKSMNDYLSEFNFKLVNGIYFKNEITQKKTIYIHIGKLLKNYIRMEELFSYETKYNGVISNLITNTFNLEFESITYNRTDKGKCYLKKTQGSDLKLICFLTDYGYSKLKQTNEQIELNDINYKYNFVLVPIINNEQFFISYDWDSYIQMTIPQTLNFTLEDSLTIKYLMPHPKDSINIKLNPDSDYLNCSDTLKIKTCIVPMTHFQGKSDGYYNTLHSFKYNETTLLTNTYYESTPFNVIVRQENEIVLRIKQEDNQEGVKIGNEGIIYFITDYNDKGKNIFNNEDIEDKTHFDTKIKDLENNEYNIECNLWKHNNEKIVLLCYMNETFKNQKQSIIFDIKTISYNNYSVLIYQKDYIQVEKNDYNIPFLYSNEQFIEIVEDKDIYELKFKIGVYNNDILFLKGTFYNYGIIDKCQVKGKELVCQVSKEKLEEILTTNNEAFYLGTMNDNLGIIKYNFVSNIIIYCNITKKEDIYVGVTNITDEISEIGTAFGLVTNITSLPNINTGTLNTLYLKKTRNKPLLLLHIIDYETDFDFTKLEEEFVLDDIHYKYNFKIQPYELNKSVHVQGNGTEIMIAYPEVLDFQKDEEITIYYLMPNPELGKNIKLNKDFPDLECEDLIKMKKCVAYKSHFDYWDSGDYNTYHSNHLGNLSLYYNPAPFNVILPNKVLRITKGNNKETIYFGLNGTLYIVTDYNDTEQNIFNASDIEEKTNFETTFRDELGNYYNTKCRLWKPLGENIRLFCDLNDILNIHETHITLNKTSLIYDKYNIYIISEEKSLTVQQLSISVPFLYGEKQIINMEKDKESYDLKFKIGKYDNELLVFLNNYFSNIILYECNIEGKDLTCTIHINQLEEIQLNKEMQFILASTNEIFGFYPIYSCFLLTVNYYQIEKENIYVLVTNLLEKNYEVDNFIAYETNVTDISDIITDEFKIGNKSDYIYCLFKKIRRNNLLLLCQQEIGGNHSLGEITEEIKLIDINVKYNFFIIPQNNTEVYTIKNRGTFMQLIYPLELDFTSKDSYTIEFIMYAPEIETGVKLYPRFKELECIDYPNLKKCIVPKSHFLLTSSGNYYYSYKNDYNEQFIHYESTPIRVILPDDNIDLTLKIRKEDNYFERTIGKNGVLYFITDFNDYDFNLFNSSNIEEKTAFETKLTDEEGNKYVACCRLWKPFNETLRIICKLNESLIHSYNYINIDKVKFEYNNEFNISIISEFDKIPVNQLNITLPFIYSDKQIINADYYGEYSYELKFKFETYNDELLELYDSLNEIILDKCYTTNKELICTINKETIEEILNYNGEAFSINILNDEIGVYHLDTIFDIEIYYANMEKFDVHLKVTKLLKNKGEAYNFIAYETETDYSMKDNIITKSFSLSFNNNFKNDRCFLKKYEGSSLLLLCMFQSEGEYYLNNTGTLKLENIHIKYNFYIQNITNYEIITISDFGSFIYINHPLILNFTENDNITIRYSLLESNYVKKIRLNPNSEDIECELLPGMSKCVVPISHFNYGESGYYYTYYTNHLGELSKYYEASPFYVIMPEHKLIQMVILEKDNNKTLNVGINGTLYFVTDYNDNDMDIFNSSDIEEKTKFNNIITDTYGNNYTVSCRLWKPNDGIIRIICNLEEDLSKIVDNISFNRITFLYGDYQIEINSQIYIKVNLFNYQIPFLYSDKQIINIEEEKDIYDFKFKFDSYNKEKLYIASMKGKILEHCQANKKEIICSITKQELDTIIANTEELEFGAIIEKYGVINFISVSEIIINYPLDIKKEDIFVSITKLLYNTTEILGTYAYETNISYIPNINTELFILNETEGNVFYYFKKSNNSNLLLICLPITNGTFNLGKIYGEIILDSIHYKYNFRIQQGENYETISVEENGAYIGLIYPEVLNFTSEEAIDIYYLTSSPKNARYINLNPKSYYLDCYDLEYLKKCTVYPNHFDGLESGYYNTYHLNHLGDYSIYYDADPFYVILPEKEKSVDIIIDNFYHHDTIEIGINGTLYFIRNYDDTKTNIFNASDIEEKTYFETILYDENKVNRYNIKCRLWKPSNELIRIFCDLEGKLNETEQKVFFDYLTIDYNDYKVNIIFKTPLSVKQYDYNMPFLYSDKQIINIYDGIDSYNLKFKIGKYNEEKIILISEIFCNIILDECQIEGKDLICSVNKSSLDKILQENKDILSISCYNEIKLFDFKNIMDIIINRNYTDKEIVYVGITNLLQETVDFLSFITYETNVSDISDVNTHLFDMEFELNNYSCFLKKNIESNLLFLCFAEFMGSDCLGVIEKEVILNDINIKYDFYIQPVTNKQYFNISGASPYIITAYPIILDFTSADNLTIDYVIPLSQNVTIKLNPDATELECINGENTKRCIVPKSHFENKKSGYYYTYHLNYLKKYAISYEFSPIEVILPDDGKNTN